MDTRVERKNRREKRNIKKVTGLGLLIFGLLSFVLSIFPNFLNIGYFFQGLFGVLVYPLFLLLFLVGMALVLNMNYTFDKKYTIYLSIAFTCLLCLCHTIFSSKVLLNDYTAFNNFKDYLANCYNMANGITVGGAVMGILVFATRCLIGLGGTYVFFAIFATVFIGLIIDYAIYSKGKNKRKKAIEAKPSFKRMNNQDIPESNDNLYSFSTKKPQHTSLINLEKIDEISEVGDGQYSQGVPLFETNDTKTQDMLDMSRDINFSFNKEDQRIETKSKEEESRERAKSTLFGDSFDNKEEDF